MVVVVLLLLEFADHAACQTQISFASLLLNTYDALGVGGVWVGAGEFRPL